MIMLRVHLRNFLSIFLLLSALPLHSEQPLPAQEPVLGDKPVAIETLSHEPNRRTFAKPLPLDNGQTLYFERDGDQPRLWRLDWKTNIATPSLIKNLPVQDDKKRYTAVKTSAGIWLIGPVVMLIHPDDRQEILSGFDANEPTSVPLNDGSVLVLGHGMHDHTEQMRRLVPTPQGIVVEDKGLLPNYLSGQNVNYKARYGVAAVMLADGRVFTAGGGYDGDAQRAAFVDPLTGTVQAATDMPHKRTYAVLMPLSDGRIVVAGHPHLRCYDQDVRTVDIFDPKSNQWQSLPDLPFPLCADAYNADGPSGVVLPDGKIVLGGYLEQHLMALHPDAKGVNGYANAWEVIGPTDRMRISGTLQALSNNEVVIAGGVHHLDFGGCCYGTPGAERVALPAESGDQPTGFRSVGLPLQGVGVAQRNGKLFIASGRQFSFTSTGQLRYSSLVELLDLQTGRVQQLPVLPFVTGGAQVAWLDDDHVLVKGQAVETGSGGFTPGSNLSSYIPASSGAMAVYSISNRQWSKPVDPEALRNVTLLNTTLLNTTRLNANGDEIIFIATSNASMYRLHWSTQQLDMVATSPVMHSNVIARRLQDGRVILAGGEMQRQRISLIDEQCESAASDPDKECKEQFTGWGPLLPALRYQWYTPSVSGGQGNWQLSEPDSLMESYDPNSEVLQTLIDAEGRVIRFVHPSDSCCDKLYASLKLERSSGDGKSWQSLPGPSEIIVQSGSNKNVFCTNGCRLQLVADPRHPEKELLFLREGVQEDDYASERFDRDNFHKDTTRSMPPVHVWVLDETASTPQWQEVLRADEYALRRQPLPLTGPLAGMQSLGWHLPQPVLWVGK